MTLNEKIEECNEFQTNLKIQTNSVRIINLKNINNLDHKICGGNIVVKVIPMPKIGNMVKHIDIDL